ncbi:unnamed protein product [Cylindrotheca closterium]|uniref:Uncharacterized protein n=1 Tax=Cylindrotheca closterium TaxID=2856 RepID=A0AAD2CRU0_9STRA|nr:unnamed protein product [Cylindrotheca closterium]
MEPCIVDASPTHSIREPLLDKSNKDEDVNNPEISHPIKDATEAEATIIEQLMGSQRNCYAIGQWIWLSLAWSYISLLPYYPSAQFNDALNLQRVLLYLLAMVGHGFFLVMLARFPGHQASRLSQVNEETLPAILSGLRVFCFGDKNVPVCFLLISAVVFLLLEICGGSVCPALYRILVQETPILHDMETEHYKCHLQSKPKQTTCLEDGSASQETSGALGFESDNNEIKDLNITKEAQQRIQWQRSWFAVGQWIWLLSVWFVIAQYLLSETVLATEDVAGVSGAIAMFGHGISLAVHTCRGGNSASLGCINRENLPMILSACFIVSWEDYAKADDFLRIIAKCCLLLQALGAARRFTLTMIFKTFASMEKDHFESLKEKEADEAVQLQMQMERMSYMDSLPSRRHLVKGRSKRVILCFYLLVVLAAAAQYCVNLIDFR